jgi:hypothetical protein
MKYERGSKITISNVLVCLWHTVVETLIITPPEEKKNTNKF